MITAGATTTSSPARQNSSEQQGRRWHRPLLAAAFVMIALALFSALAMVVDDRTLMNESVWVKTLKFGVSFGAYLFTLAWLIGRLVKARRLGWIMGTAFAMISVAEVGVIAVAAALGTYSHFNTSDDPINLVVQAVFKNGVPLLLLVNVIIAVMVLCQRVGDRAVTTTVRWGLFLASLGMFAAFFIVSVGGQGKRVVEDANGTTVTLNAGHGVGDLDGNGMFLTNWSITGGDMRVAHFIGLHGIQVLILLAVVLSGLAVRYPWLREDLVRSRLVRFAAVGYLGVLITAGWQAVRGQSVVAPDVATLGALAISVAVAVAGMVLTIRHARSRPAVVDRDPAHHESASRDASMAITVKGYRAER